MDLSPEELLALGASACYTAAMLSESKKATREEKKAVLDLISVSSHLIKTSGLSPTQLKDLGIKLVKEMRE